MVVCAVLLLLKRLSTGKRIIYIQITTELLQYADLFFISAYENDIIYVI